MSHRPRLALAAPLLVLALGAPASAQRWEELGPAPIAGGDFVGSTGRVAALALSSKEPNTYYVATASGGVWRSKNGGGNWLPRTDELPTTALGAIALDPRNEKVVYAGSGEANYAYHSLYGAGIYKSTDSGKSFRVLAAERFEGQAFSRLVVGPDGTVWAAVSRAGGTANGIEGARGHPRRIAPMGLFKSTDGGGKWKLVRSGLPPLPAADVDLDPDDPKRIFVTSSDVFGDPRNGVYLSTNGGKSFREVLGIDGATIGRIALAIAPGDPDFVYAIACRPAGRQTTGGFTPVGDSTLGLFASTDGGRTWTMTNPGNFLGDQGAYDIAIAVSPQDPRIVFLGGVQVVRSTDGGATFANVTPPHVDIHDLAFDRNRRLVAAGDGGVFRSNDLGSSWQTLNGGLGIVQYYGGIAIHPLAPELVVAGSQDNGTHVRRPDGRWDEVFGGDGGWIAARADDPDIFVVQFQGTGTIFLTTDGGDSFDFLGDTIDENDRTAFQAPLLFDPPRGGSTAQALFYATQRLWVSDGGGPTGFRAVSGDLTAGPPWAIRALAVSPTDAGTLYATANDGGVLASADRGVTWTRGPNVAGWPRILRQVAVDPADANLAVVVDGAFRGPAVLLTRDHGATWSEIGRKLPDLPISAVAIHRFGDRRQIFVGTDRGVYATIDDGADWTLYGTDLPNAPVHDVVVDAAHARVYAATLGRGVWRTRLAAVGPGA